MHTLHSKYLDGNKAMIGKSIQLIQTSVDSTFKIGTIVKCLRLEEIENFMRVVDKRTQKEDYTYSGEIWKLTNN